MYVTCGDDLVNSDAIESVGVVDPADRGGYRGGFAVVVRSATGREYLYFEGDGAQARAAATELAEMLVA